MPVISLCPRSCRLTGPGLSALGPPWLRQRIRAGYVSGVSIVVLMIDPASYGCATQAVAQVCFQ